MDNRDKKKDDLLKCSECGHQNDLPRRGMFNRNRFLPGFAWGLVLMWIVLQLTKIGS